MITTTPVRQMPTHLVPRRSEGARTRHAQPPPVYPPARGRAHTRAPKFISLYMLAASHFAMRTIITCNDTRARPRTKPTSKCVQDRLLAMLLFDSCWILEVTISFASSPGSAYQTEGGTFERSLNHNLLAPIRLNVVNSKRERG